MTANVTINELANLPHHEGQVVLHVLREEVEVRRRRDNYVVYGFVRQPSGGVYTRLAAARRKRCTIAQTLNRVIRCSLRAIHS